MFPIFRQQPQFAQPRPQFAPQQVAPQQFAPQQVAQPRFAQPQAQLAQPRPAAQPAVWPQPGAARPQTPPRPAPAATLALNQAPAPRVRMQGPDTLPAAPTPASAMVQPAPQALALPSPESLGIVPASPAAPAPSGAAPSGDVDWNDLRNRLRQLGAVGFHLDQVAGGQWQATMLVPTGPGAQPQRLEGVAASEAGAVASVLAQASR